MALYNNISQKSPIDTVEFIPASQGNTAFFRLKPGADTESVKQWLTEDMGQQIEAVTRAGNQAILVTHGDKTEQETLSSLKSHGETLTTPEAKGKINLWKLRGWASIIGQPLQLISGLLQKGPPDIATIGFAVTNMAANLTNVFFGAQKDSDAHHLRFVKKAINQQIAPYLPEGVTPPDINDRRSDLHRKPEERTLGQKAYDLMRRYSVTVGEIGLRYIGAISLVLPITKEVNGKQSLQHWRDGAKQLSEGAFAKAYKTVSNRDAATRYVGLAYILGKAIALFSQTPDPYNKTDKHTWIDTVREKVTFKLSSTIEALAATLLTLDRFNLYNFKDDVDKTKIKKRSLSAKNLIAYIEKKEIKTPELVMKGLKKIEFKRDWIGGAGGALFAAGLFARIMAPFGVREVDMQELNAHAADSLALVPPEKLPQAVADTSAYLSDHFKGSHLDFGKVYGELTGDLKRFHNITLPATGANDAQVAQASAPAAHETVNDTSISFAKPELRKSGLASMPHHASYQDRALAPEAASVGIGA